MQFLVTPIILISLLSGPLVLVLAWRCATSKRMLRNSTAGCLGIALLFAFTGVGHFIKTGPMADMLPAYIPGRIWLVYFTGVLEMAAGIAVLSIRWRKPVACGLIAMLIAFLPVNIYAAINRIGPGGHALGPVYLLLRVPLQLFVGIWIYWFAIHPGNTKPPVESGGSREETLSDSVANG